MSAHRIGEKEPNVIVAVWFSRNLLWGFRSLMVASAITWVWASIVYSGKSWITILFFYVAIFFFILSSACSASQKEKRNRETHKVNPQHFE